MLWSLQNFHLDKSMLIKITQLSYSQWTSWHKLLSSSFLYKSSSSGTIFFSRIFETGRPCLILHGIAQNFTLKILTIKYDIAIIYLYIIHERDAVYLLSFSPKNFFFLRKNFRLPIIDGSPEMSCICFDNF